MKHLRDKENKEINNSMLKEKVSQMAHKIPEKIENEKTKWTKSDQKGQWANSIKKLFDKETITNKIMKKNQVVLVATALMLVTAGYLNYSNNIKTAELGDAQLVSANVTTTEDEITETPITNEETIDDNQKKIDNSTEERAEEEKSSQSEANLISNETEIKKDDFSSEQETAKTSANTNDSEYFTKTKLEREKMYSQMMETYQKILENNSIPNDQKGIASNEIKNINNIKSAIGTAENLIKIKGFEDVIILVNNNSVNVVAKSTNKLETSQVAQIQNVVSRELNTEIEDIHITTHE